MKNSSNPQALAALLALSLGGAAYGVEHGSLSIIQRNTSNNNQSNANPAVSVSVNPGNSISFLGRGHSKGDFELQFTKVPGNDPTLGTLLSSVSQNSRNNGVSPNAGGPAGLQYAVSGSEPSSTGYYIFAQSTQSSAQPANEEVNINVAGAWFPHAEGWLAGQFKTAATLYSSPAIRVGEEFVNVGDGTSRVNLTKLRSHGVPATSQNGVLLTCGGDNNVGSIGLSRANADGTFTVSLKHVGDPFVPTYRNGGLAFAYVPVAAAGMGQVRVVGKVQSDGGTPLKGGDFSVTKRGTGEWLLKIDGVTSDDGTLIVSAEGGLPPAGANPVPKNVNNFVSYEWSSADEGWIVQSRDISAALEDGATANEPMFSFVFLTPGENYGYENKDLPSVALTAPANATYVQIGQKVPLTANIVSPADVTVDKVDFYVGGVLVGTAATAPYTFNWTVDQLGFRTVEAFAHTTDGAVADAQRVAIYSVAQIGAPQIPGYSTAIVDGGDLESDVTELDPNYVASVTTPWSLLANTPSPLGFGSPGDVRGKPAVNINGSPIPFNSGILLGTNYAGNNYSDKATRGAIDNNVIAFASGGNYALKVDDNKQGGGDPVVRPESGRFSLGFFPFSNGWVGATVATDLSIVSGNSNLPAGVTISKTGTSDYLIEGLPMTGNLLAVAQGQNSDNLASIGRNGNRWIVRNTDNNGNVEDDSFSFLYVPTTAPQVFSGLVAADGTLTPLNENLSAIGAQVTMGPNGYEIQFGDGTTINPSNTALFVAPDFNSGNGADNIYSYYASGNKFVVFSHDLPGITGTIQNSGFRFVATPIAPASNSGTDVFVSATVNQVDEGGSLSFRFSRIGGNSTQPLTATYAVSGTATSGTDYTGLTGTVTFPAGVTVVDIPVPALADQVFELDETVIVTVQKGTGYAAAGGVATGVIRNVLYQPSVKSVSFQQGANDYSGEFGKRVGSDGTHQLEVAVQNYALDGLDTAGSPDVNGIIRFDNIFGSAEGQIPVGATILKAELVLTTAVADSAQSPGPWVVDRLVFPVDATTNYIQMTQGSFAGVRGLSARTPVAGYGNLLQGDVSSADVTRIMRVWAAAADPNAANLGFSIYDSTTSDGWNYCTSGNDDVQKRPKLLISYVSGKPTQSYSLTADKSVRLAGSDPSVDGSTLGMSFIDQVTGATQEGIFHFPVGFGANVGAIPLDEEIVRAELVLNSSSASYTNGSVDARSSGPVAVHRMLEDWTVESYYGFNGPVVGTNVAIAEKARAAGLGNGTTATFDVTATVRAWREGSPNFGINVKPETGDGWQFFWPGTTGDYADKVPKLVIYTTKESTSTTDGFDLWASANGITGVSRNSDAADHDGIPALIEYALGLNPMAPDQLPGLTRNGGNMVLSFAKGAQAAGDSHVSYHIMGSPDLVTWTEDASAVDTASGISITAPVGTGRKFFRLEVRYTP